MPSNLNDPFPPGPPLPVRIGAGPRIVTAPEPGGPVRGRGRSSRPPAPTVPTTPAVPGAPGAGSREPVGAGAPALPPRFPLPPPIPERFIDPRLRGALGRIFGPRDPLKNLGDLCDSNDPLDRLRCLLSGALALFVRLPGQRLPTLRPGLRPGRLPSRIQPTPKPVQTPATPARPARPGGPFRRDRPFERPPRPAPIPPAPRTLPIPRPFPGLSDLPDPIVAAPPQVGTIILPGQETQIAAPRLDPRPGAAPSAVPGGAPAPAPARTSPRTSPAPRTSPTGTRPLPIGRTSILGRLGTPISAGLGLGLGRLTFQSPSVSPAAQTQPTLEPAVPTAPTTVATATLPAPFRLPRSASSTSSRARECEEVPRRRRRRGRCREGFFEELPGRTRFITWRTVECRTRRTITET